MIFNNSREKWNIRSFHFVHSSNAMNVGSPKLVYLLKELWLRYQRQRVQRQGIAWCKLFFHQILGVAGLYSTGQLVSPVSHQKSVVYSGSMQMYKQDQIFQKHCWPSFSPVCKLKNTFLTSSASQLNQNWRQAFVRTLTFKTTITSMSYHYPRIFYRITFGFEVICMRIYIYTYIYTRAHRRFLSVFLSIHYIHDRKKGSLVKMQLLKK